MKRQQMTELKPCPFCDGSEDYGPYEDDGGFIVCSYCGARAPNAELWNTRAVPELPEGYREEEHPRYGWMCLVNPDGYTIAREKRDGFNLSGGHSSFRETQALVIWLQRK